MEEKSTIPQIQLTKRSDLYKIVIPASVERTIRFLCSKVWNVEWSGVLFYTVTGTFEDNNLVVRCEDIYPMDIGSSGYTEFDMSPDVISYMAQNPELLGCKMGLVHSHNNMSTFFSGTDQSTLKEEGRDRNHFVSLIVNNAGSYTAAITRKVKYVESREISYPSFDGVVVQAHETFEELEEIEWFNLSIEFEGEHNNKFNDIDARLNEIKKTKEANKPASTTSIPSFYSSYNSNTYEHNPTDNKESGKELTLFNDDFDWEYIDNKLSSDTTLSTQTINKKLNKDLLNSLKLQLLTGSIIADNEFKVDINKWLNNMEKRFDKRFKDDDNPEKLTLFTYWATGYIEFLVWYAIDDYNVDEDEAAGSISEALIKELESLPKTNKYIKEYISILHDYDRFK